MRKVYLAFVAICVILAVIAVVLFASGKDAVVLQSAGIFLLYANIALLNWKIYNLTH